MRVSGSEFEDPLVITANDYRFIAAQQLADVGIKSNAVLLNLHLRTQPLQYWQLLKKFLMRTQMR